ncbi:hypothetical protein SAMN05892883_0217 [Jatrophihabitans sp. GAS493]|uniref:hypothetical protein n=1 Tax=Jatrophihabitans sp. GAS493 TaxID=1907575 RepID=UPI000BB8F4E6|nr:hypothetical protein [Jatrophihabitans sp. GAS493]SOD70526.1 hypothetical protein SAMN05892883_0217 [Jatrophihabitans sp. GAS493]
MSEIVLLTDTAPQPEHIVSALRAVNGAYPGLRAGVEPLPGQLHGLLHLVTPDGDKAVTIDAARFVPVPGEAKRLLGVECSEPAWWTEVRAGAGPESGAIQQLFATTLAEALGGDAVIA